MNHTYTDELYHFGIKGMKWGRRRFQNEDGSLTSAGREHYRVATGVASKIKAVKEMTKNTALDPNARNQPYKSQPPKEAKSEKVERTIPKDAKKAINEVKNSPEYKAERNTNIKKVMIGAAVVGGVALAAYGGYKLSQSKKKFGSYSSNGKAYMESANRNRAIDNAYASLFEKASVQYRLGQDDKGRMTEFAKKSTEANVNRLKYENKSEDAYNKARRTAYYKLHTKKGKQKLDSKYGAHNAAQYTYSAIYNNPNDWSATIREQYSHETKKNKPSYLADVQRFSTTKKKKRGR